MGRINIGALGGIRVDENGEAKNRGEHNNPDLHEWTFDRFVDILTYKAMVEGMETVEVFERATSKACCVYMREDARQRVERGISVCEECDAAFNSDVNGAENIRPNINQCNSESAPDLDEDTSTSWLAQLAVYLQNMSYRFQPQKDMVDCKLEYRNPTVWYHEIPPALVQGRYKILYSFLRRGVDP